MKWYYFVICAVICGSGCTTQSVTPTRLSRTTIDTTYQRKILQLQPEMDSVCKIVYKKYFNSAVDSIMNVRQMEMDNLVK